MAIRYNRYPLCVDLKDVDPRERVQCSGRAKVSMSNRLEKNADLCEKCGEVVRVMLGSNAMVEHNVRLFSIVRLLAIKPQRAMQW